MPTAVPRAALPALLLVVMLVAGCGATPPSGAAPSSPGRLAAPAVGTCHDLSAADLSEPTVSVAEVACSRPHTAQTFFVGALPESTGPQYDNRRHGAHVFAVCDEAFAEFIGADESVAIRTWLDWAWFRPSPDAWARGARWFHCDVVGGPADGATLRRLPENAESMLDKRRLPDKWMTCAQGTSFVGSTKVPCDRQHRWRAVATVKIGQPEDPYPGDRVVEVRSRDRCGDWLTAANNYEGNFEYGHSSHHRAEWEAGLRRAVCWAQTTS